MRVAVITGAAQGIGRRTAELFAQQGYALALIDLQPSGQTLAAISTHHVPAFEFQGDISNEETVARFAANVNDKWGRVDVLVNNAGISFIAPAETVSGADFRKVLDVNLLA